MKHTRLTLAWILTLMTCAAFLSGCGKPVDAQQPATTTPEAAMHLPMSREEAMDIARNSGACAEAGSLTDNAVYNDYTGTWWIDLDADKPGCAPACVINAADKTAEVNWRCTGALPPLEEGEDSAPEAGLLQQGEMDAAGPATENHALDDSQQAICWGGFIKSLPAGGQFDDYMALEGENGVGLEAVDNTIAAQIQVVRDSDTLIHLWGELYCPAIDYGGCQLLVTRLREDRPGPLPDPEAVEGWAGTLGALEPGAQFDRYFTLMGNAPVRYGISSIDSAVEAQLTAFQQTGELVRVWGQVTCGVPSPNGAHINVTRVECVGAP